MYNRRTVSKAIAGAAIAAISPRMLSAAAADAAAPSPLVKTTAGTIEGSFDGTIYRFLGIPYGAPTGAASRFLPPQPVAPWRELRKVTAYGDSCPQISLGLSPFVARGAGAPKPAPPTAMQQQLGTLFGRAKVQPASSEDCLRLNVWSTGLSAGKRPVMVWLHGGGFATGSGSAPTYEGSRLAARGDVVVVTINHRLNVFGHLYLGEIGGDAFAQSGNVGMLDIVAALQWVRDNIAEFGGDPGNVTIFGESGGAGKVSVICAMPAAKGLFHKAIMQSGPCLQIADRTRATAIAEQLLKDLNLSAGQLSQLQQMDAAMLAQAADAAETKVVPRVLGFGPMGLIPLIDGIGLTHHPFDTIAAPESANVPFMVGSTKDEATLFVGPLPQWGMFTEADIVRWVQPLAGARAQNAVDLYKKLHPSDSPSYLLVDLVTDYWMRQAANQVAELKVRQNSAPVFVYVLEWELNPQLRSPHGTDVALAFDNIDASTAIQAAANAQAVSDQMSAAWIAFARYGNPNNPHLPKWAPYSNQARSNMLFNVASRSVDDYGGLARKFWEHT